jgi:hypothetical protein
MIRPVDNGMMVAARAGPQATVAAGDAARPVASAGGIDSRARPRANSMPRTPRSAESAATRRSVPTFCRNPSVSTR